MAPTRHGAPDRPLVVIESTPPPGERTNPYIIQLVDSLPAGIEVHYMDWRRALVGRYDVFHLHWPEVVLRGRDAPRSLFRALRFLVLLVRIRLTRVALVRTFHNEAPHEPLHPLQRRIAGLCDRWTTLWIVMNESSRAALPPGAPTEPVPHGHYRDWFAEPAAVDPVAGRLLFFGLVRPYKGVADLLRVVAASDDPDLSLRIVGQVQDDEVRRLLDDTAADDRISVVDRYVGDDELVDELAAAELVVCPFTRVTNSGSILLALSLDRPILVPEGEMTSALAEEVGHDWVLTYRPPLGHQHLVDALAHVRSTGGGRPDLSARDWDVVGAAHARAFRRAVDLVRGA